MHNCPVMHRRQQHFPKRCTVAVGMDAAGAAGCPRRQAVRAVSRQSRSRGGGESAAAPRPLPVRHRRGVPEFPPVRARGRRFLPGRRRIAAVVMAVAAVCSTAAAFRAHSAPPPPPTPAAPDRGGARPERTVSVPVRVSDAAAVRLLRGNDRVDVIAAPDGHGHARMVARCGRVALVPKSGDTVPGDGALVVLAVPRATAIALADASSKSRLTVALC